MDGLTESERPVGPYGELSECVATPASGDEIRLETSALLRRGRADTLLKPVPEGTRIG